MNLSKKYPPHQLNNLQNTYLNLKISSLENAIIRLILKWAWMSGDWGISRLYKNDVELSISNLEHDLQQAVEATKYSQAIQNLIELDMIEVFNDKYYVLSKSLIIKIYQ